MDDTPKKVIRSEFFCDKRAPKDICWEATNLMASGHIGREKPRNLLMCVAKKHLCLSSLMIIIVIQLLIILY